VDFCFRRRRVRNAPATMIISARLRPTASPMMAPVPTPEDGGSALFGLWVVDLEMAFVRVKRSVWMSELTCVMVQVSN
jgi:hypothetical protein